MTKLTIPLAVGTLFLCAAPMAMATPLAPHSAVYDLSLAEQSRDVAAAEGRIAVELTQPECGVYALDYRFVARFTQNGEMTLTDQRMVARESTDGSSFEYEAWTYLDGMEYAHVKGRARTQGGQTLIDVEVPAARALKIEASQFPLGHTVALIAAARGGERFRQSPLFDGDEAAEKGLTTTAVILPASERIESAPETDDLAGWRITEAYFNDDSDGDGLPIFQTRYTLFENGISDDLFMDFGDYALQGAISELTMGEVPEGCAG